MIKPTRSIYIEFDDREGNGLTDEQQDEMTERMRKIANEYGYDWHSSGDEVSMRKWFTMFVIGDIQEYINEKHR